MAQPEKYSKVQIALHWGIAGLMVVSYFSSEAMGAAWRVLMKTGTVDPTIGVRVHVVMGVLILALAVLRLVIRMVQGAPAPIETGKPLQDKAAKAIHVGLYLAMLALPAAGLAAWFGGITTAAEAHEVLFNIGMALVILHVAAALMHQFVLKDNLMARMK
ncbi:cytochrome b [Thalassovita sp.]|uniref:cytochrome b n=1 Tax=Thalassovita sp. TaxID=1979401 RepID=UPI002B275CBF|nr:cytochrome b/b6 domain-containing protein [Thalassovita sp.]